MSDLCSIQVANTGKPACDVDFGSIKYLIRTGNSFALTAAEWADSAALQAKLTAAAKLPNSNPNKVWIFPVYETTTNNTGDAPTATLGTLERVLRDATPKYLVEAGGVGLEQQKALCVFNGSTGRMFIVDNNNRFAGVVQTDGSLKGFSYSDLYTNPPSFNGTDDYGSMATRINFGNVDEFKISPTGIVGLEFSADALPRLQDVTISIVSLVGNVLKVKAKTKFGGTDLYASHSTALNNVARWVLYNESDAAAITIDSVATDAAGKAWNLTSTALGALATGKIYSINLADPATLDAAGVTGIEGTKATATKA